MAVHAAGGYLFAKWWRDDVMFDGTRPRRYMLGGYTCSALKHRNGDGRMAQPDTTRTVGLALEGGGYRGMYTAGVLDVWMEHGLTCDHMVGVSAGAPLATTLNRARSAAHSLQQGLLRRQALCERDELVANRRYVQCRVCLS